MAIFTRMFGIFFWGLLGSIQPLSSLEIKLAFLSAQRVPRVTLSNLDPIPEDIAAAGFFLGLADNGTTGKFLGQSYSATEYLLPLGEIVEPIFDEVIGQSDFIVADLPGDLLLKLADHAAGTNVIIFNVFDQGDALRNENCHTRVLHTIPSYGMRADALSQVLVSKKWTKVALLHGANDADIAFVEAMRVSLDKFSLKLRGDKEWTAGADIRRSAASEMPLFTQGFKDHDVLIVIDESDDFGRYVPYNTWRPSLIAGTEGLRPLGWDKTVEQWGAAQLQSRFMELASRPMQSRDYAAWVAVRSVGEAVIRTNSDDPKVIRSYLLSSDFELAGFKGRPLSYRKWNGQLRQPIAVVSSTAQVASAPLEGFLHQTNEMDSLGSDQPETGCSAFKEGS